MQSFENFEAISSAFTAVYFLASAAVVGWIGLEFHAARPAKKKSPAAGAECPQPAPDKILYPNFKPSRAA